MSDIQPEVFQEIRVPDAWTQGVYANGITAWFVETDATLDFIISLPAEPRVHEEKQVVVIPQRVVARVKLSPGMLVYAGMQIASLISDYETRYGKIPPLQDQPPLIPPSLDDNDGGSHA